MGGTFDPIHNGHLLLGRQAYEEYHMDQIWYMPSGQPPHKRDHRITSAEDRCAMVQVAIADLPYCVLSTFEIDRQGNTYTAQTLRLLHEAYPEHEFYFIIGADSLYQLETWFHPEEVMKQCTLLVAGREYEDASMTIEQRIEDLTRRYGAKIYRLHNREVDIASAEIRDMTYRGGSIEKLVPKKVNEYIKLHHLYEKI